MNDNKYVKKVLERRQDRIDIADLKEFHAGYRPLSGNGKKRDWVIGTLLILIITCSLCIGLVLARLSLTTSTSLEKEQYNTTVEVKPIHYYHTTIEQINHSVSQDEIDYANQIIDRWRDWNENL